MSGVRFPSEQSFQAVPDISETEVSSIVGYCDPSVFDEFTAALVVQILKRTSPGEERDHQLGTVSLDNGSVTFDVLMRELFGWSSSETASFEARWFTESTFYASKPRYVAALVAYHGDNIMPLLSVLESPYVPELIPLQLLSKFFQTRAELREEGVTLRNKTLLALCYYWSADDIYGFLRSEQGEDLDGVLKMRAAGLDTADEIMQMKEGLPPELLKELFG